MLEEIWFSGMRCLRTYIMHARLIQDNFAVDNNWTHESSFESCVCSVCFGWISCDWRLRCIREDMETFHWRPRRHDLHKLIHEFRFNKPYHEQTTCKNTKFFHCKGDIHSRLLLPNSLDPMVSLDYEILDSILSSPWELAAILAIASTDRNVQIWTRSDDVVGFCSPVWLHTS